MTTKRYILLKADLLGNDDDGYDWNDTIPCGSYNIPDSAFTGNDRACVENLVKEGVFDRQALKASDIKIDIQSDGIAETFYIAFTFPENAPRSRESFELHPIV